jgi:carboxypeptidase family protein
MVLQTSNGSITGVITNPDGPVADATIQAKQRATGRVFTATSGKSGAFTLNALPEGAYDIQVPPLGISSARFTRENVGVERGRTTMLDITLAKLNQGVIGDDNAFLVLHNKYANVTGPAPRLPNGRPDLSGVWNRTLDQNPEPASLLPWATDVLNARRANAFRDLPASFCLPDPTPTAPLLQRIVQTPTMIVALFEEEPHYRQIFLDGRPHPVDADPTWMGHSIGHWKRDTLVVDTVALNDKSWILFATNLPHTEMLHMTERYRRIDRGHLAADLKLEDPGAFSKPVERHMIWELAPGEEILESICAENNKYVENAGLR